ncbi:hypothetical protein PHET_09213 [Paragonimus heterotremus]|uniref:Cytochrome c oxidase assembly factor 3 n=1 Tax=Paragonimus heterotremus TaxID=100268 RepID=A0A8J4WUH8_9TREM|nr:hypothetical protein PHET_09213 [Paragonimus heterotremus]
MENDVLKRFMKYTEKSNIQRSGLVRAHNRRNLSVMLIASAVAVGTYVLSIYAISRDRHLDESFDRLPDYQPGKY